jgi:predicted ATPase
MAFSISKIILHNRAPFEHLELDFANKGIIVLTAVNGGGKTTILSHIVDAWYELVRIGFPQEFEGKEGKYYRVSSSLYNLDNLKSSVFYIRFMNNEKNYDYIDIRGKIEQAEYDNIISLSDKIPYSGFKKNIERSNNIKYISILDKDLQNIFQENIITSFPAYRYEEPGYLNDPFEIEMDYKMRSSFSGYLENPIEVISGLPKLANWIMDIILDKNVNKRIQIIQVPDGVRMQNSEKIQKTIEVDVTPETMTISLLNNLIRSTLISKPKKGIVRLGIGPRYSGGTRISIMNDYQGGSDQFYPTIFNLSSGEQALFSLFGELIRQFDTIKPNQETLQATGVVLIDEIDKHLHIILQTEILPKLFKLFPNIQFIISSHSPFVSMGLFNDDSSRVKMELIDLDKNGLKSDIASTQIFKEAYETMIGENERYKNLFEKLKESSKPILYVEDKIDAIYKIAWLKLNDISFSVDEIDAKFDSSARFIVESGRGAGSVAGLLNCDNPRFFEGEKIIGLFDYDKEGSEKFHHNINVAGFCPRDKNIQGNINDGFYRKRNDHECMVALLLPVPQRLEGLITSKGDWTSDAKYANYVEIETLLPESFLENNPNYEKDNAPILHYKAKDSKKRVTGQELVNVGKAMFNDFIPLFKRVNEFFDLSQEIIREPISQ